MNIVSGDIPVNAPRPASCGCADACDACTSDDVKTRDRIHGLIGQAGPITTRDIAQRLSMTSAGVRRHLDALEADGLVQTGPARSRSGPGRPARAYVLTDAGHNVLSSTYDDFALSALRFIARTYGPDAVEAFAADCAKAIEAKYRPQVEAAGERPAERLRALAVALNNDGFAAAVRAVVPEPGAPQHNDNKRSTPLQLCQGHCPVRAVAAEFPQICDAESATFERLLGVPVRRLATLSTGAHACTTHITISVPSAGDTTERTS